MRLSVKRVWGENIKMMIVYDDDVNDCEMDDFTLCVLKKEKQNKKRIEAHAWLY